VGKPHISITVKTQAPLGTRQLQNAKNANLGKMLFLFNPLCALGSPFLRENLYIAVS
jgi:hypothetical protein